MKTIFIGKNCIKLQKTDSTNSYLARLAIERNMPDGTVVVTGQQEQGRGQRGSFSGGEYARWESEPGKNLTLSILLNPGFLTPDVQFKLSKAVSLGVAEFIASAIDASRGQEGRVKIKWPNDIYIGNKKVAGILIENSVNGNSIRHSIVGIGINVNQENFSSLLPNPTSLRLVIGQEFNLGACLENLCSCVEKRYLQLRSASTHSQVQDANRTGLDADYLKNLYRYNESADFYYKGDVIRAKIAGVTKAGKLILEEDNGKILEYNFKEIEYALPSL